MKYFMLLLFVLTVSSCALPAEAANSKDDGVPADIQVEVGKVTEIVFPSEVAKVVKGGVPDAILVEVLNNSIFLLLKTNQVSDIFVSTVSGISYPLTLHLGSSHDIKVKVGFFGNKNSNDYKGTYADEMDLMKDLILQKEPIGSTVIPSFGKMYLSNKEIEVTIDKAYEIAHWNAYTLMAKNLTKKPIVLPIEQVSLPNLIAISSEKDQLLARGQEGDSTKVYLIVGQ